MFSPTWPYCAFMVRLAANISTMFNELPFNERIQAAANAGFRAVECQLPYDLPANELRGQLDDAETAFVLLNAPPGDMAAGDRGLAAVDGRDQEFRSSIEKARSYAEVLGCTQVHVMAGCPTDSAAADRYVQRLGEAADTLATIGADVLIEPLNVRDVPGYFLVSSRQAERVIVDVGRPNVRLQFDTYHLQIQEGDLAATFARCQSIIGHVQISALPDRSEPDRGEVDHRWLLDEIDRSGYGGWVGCEYRPRSTTFAGLSWAARYGIEADTTRV